MCKFTKKCEIKNNKDKDIIFFVKYMGLCDSVHIVTR